MTQSSSLHLRLLSVHICSNVIIDFQALHHPFTAPNPEDINDLSSARALAYDVVYNGVEVYYLLFFFSSSSVMHLVVGSPE